ncbi:IS66 family insertion sequence element accessory protein TnpA [Candidatus Contubernalis alkaliaceticus]|uniref:IS66 family insertion sequence element accessory protein TnpA n=1 Tax=Candidatus Contubernalis alkaliaceticus TaxID=338645 RepID=UPI001F4BF5C3|nr:transposase [Candidatus Contubernalis alkalaceticus]UNC91225.1 transposase [Candidatus Contubernalis alkalaceticus]UNC91292.1 transposase [Candidatus Contubernalis alkalaceticus]UNC91317.1 transposase [Candidatus Contubernalis alkalaceticus]UNC92140.1 transposase [Candidatus Contubernalis alkalaceticus]UNC92312.1 transposase [Candidatus Contubernalis alkalaceticus]
MNTREVTRKYRLNQWTQIIRECRSSGQTVKVWCADHDINPKTYYYWLRKVREAACEAIPSLEENSSIVPVNIPANADGPVSESTSQIILRFGSVTLELRNNASTTLIENTLRALQNVR